MGPHNGFDAFRGKEQQGNEEYETGHKWHPPNGCAEDFHHPFTCRLGKAGGKDETGSQDSAEKFRGLSAFNIAKYDTIDKTKRQPV